MVNIKKKPSEYPDPAKLIRKMEKLLDKLKEDIDIIKVKQAEDSLKIDEIKDKVK